MYEAFEIRFTPSEHDSDLNLAHQRTNAFERHYKDGDVSGLFALAGLYSETYQAYLALCELEDLFLEYFSDDALSPVTAEFLIKAYGNKQVDTLVSLWVNDVMLRLVPLLPKISFETREKILACKNLKRKLEDFDYFLETS